MAKVKFKDRQVTGNVGLYFICYKLSRMGWNVLPTSRNAKGIDILAYGKHGEKILTIQTKGYTKKAAIGPFRDIKHVIADFYIVAWNVYSTPKTYILTRDEIKSIISPHKDVYWVEHKDYGKPEFLEKWDKIGYGFGDSEESKTIAKIDSELNK